MDNKLPIYLATLAIVAVAHQVANHLTKDGMTGALVAATIYLPIHNIIWGRTA
jgi:hypothetical protein